MNDISNKPVTHLLFDFVSKHEVDEGIPTECDTIVAILANEQTGVPSHVIASSRKSLKQKRPRTPYSSVAFVHLAAHTEETSGNPVFIDGDELSWSALAKELKRYVLPLEPGQQRTLNLSCCSSAIAPKALAGDLDRLFTGCYYFAQDEVPFAKTAVAWGIFYLRKDVATPIKKLLVRRKGKTIPVNTARIINAAVPGVKFKWSKFKTLRNISAQGTRPQRRLHRADEHHRTKLNENLSAPSGNRRGPLGQRCQPRPVPLGSRTTPE